MNKSSKSSITASSLVDLKAELFRKQEQLKRDRLQPSGSQGQTSASQSKQTGSKKPSIWSKKNAGVKARSEKDLEQLAEERNQLDDSRKKLEAKAKFYEKMTSSDYVPDEETCERFLVDFEKKVFDQRSEVTAGVQGPLERGATREVEAQREDTLPPDGPDDEWVDYTDTLGRSRRCLRKDLPQLISMDKKLNPQVFVDKEKDAKQKKAEDLPDLMSNDMYREMLRKKWEEEEEEAAKRPQGPTHFQNVRYDEVRDMGVGYFDFSKDKIERNEQMETLQLLRDETVDQRQRREKLKQKRKAAMQARLEKVKERKRQRGELVEDDEEEEEEEKEGGKEEQKPESKADDRVPKETGVREWDIGKEPQSPWDQQMSNIRAERPAEFAPPSCYSDSQGQTRTRPRPTASYPPPKDYSPSYGNIREKTSDAGSSFENLRGTKSMSRTSYPPPKDYSSMYGNSREKTSNKSSTAGFSNWDKPSGSLDRTQPFTAGGVSALSNAKGTESGNNDDAIASALSYFRQSTAKK